MRKKVIISIIIISWLGVITTLVIAKMYGSAVIIAILLGLMLYLLFSKTID